MSSGIEHIAAHGSQLASFHCRFPTIGQGRHLRRRDDVITPRSPMTYALLVGAPYWADEARVGSLYALIAVAIQGPKEAATTRAAEQGDTHETRGFWGDEVHLRKTTVNTMTIDVTEAGRPFRESATAHAPHSPHRGPFHIAILRRPNLPQRSVIRDGFILVPTAFFCLTFG